MNENLSSCKVCCLCGLSSMDITTISFFSVRVILLSRNTDWFMDGKSREVYLEIFIFIVIIKAWKECGCDLLLEDFVVFHIYCFQFYFILYIYSIFYLIQRLLFQTSVSYFHDYFFSFKQSFLIFLFQWYYYFSSIFLLNDLSIYLNILLIVEFSFYFPFICSLFSSFFFFFVHFSFLLMLLF